MNAPAFADNYNSVAKQPYDQKAEKKDWSVSIGAGSFVSPEFEGGDEYDFTPVPYLDVKYKDRVTFNPFDGLRFNALTNDEMTLGVGLGADFGRDDDDADRLRGLGDVDPTLEGQLFAQYRYHMASAQIKFANDLGDGHDGYTVEMVAAYALPVSKQLFLTPSIRTTYASEKYMDSYFGVNETQSARSGLAQFDSENGFKDVSGNVFARYALDGNWALNGFAGYSRLIGDAADSPVTESENLFRAGTFVSYSFN